MPAYAGSNTFLRADAGQDFRQSLPGVCADQTTKNPETLFMQSSPGFFALRRLFYSCRRIYALTFSSPQRFQAPSSAVSAKGTMIEKSMCAPSK